MDELVEVQFKPVKGSNAAGTLYLVMCTIRISLRLLFWICFMVLLYAMAPVLKGDVELDHPLTTSQITAMMALCALLYMSRKVI